VVVVVVMVEEEKNEEEGVEFLRMQFFEGIVCP